LHKNSQFFASAGDKQIGDERNCGTGEVLLDALRSEIDKGRKSGIPRLAAEVFDRLERKYIKAVQEWAK
jgi:hypothetical protein